MSESFLVGKSDKPVEFLPGMANRHGLVSGATGTGKTVTLQVLAERFSRIGVPVFAADVKGDLSGVAVAGKPNDKIVERIEKMELGEYTYEGSPVVFWDLYGEKGHPIRTTVSEMGPLLLSRLFRLNDVQGGVLQLVFKIADDNGMLLLDLKDLRSMLMYVGENASEFTTEYGQISRASIGAIQRSLLTLEEQDGDKFFGEPAIDLFDFIQTDVNGRGVINLLDATKLINSPKLYSTFLLWLLSELFERLPEVGDSKKPKLVFFFDEAHLLFDDTPVALQEKIEQVVRLIRSKGVGVYFVTQSPTDLPDSVLGQLGNRVQHALRAFTPKDQKAIKAAAENFRENPKLDVEEALTSVGVGEALVSLLDEKGRPSMVKQVLIVPPYSQIGPIDSATRIQIIQNSLLYGAYDTVNDRESAYELLAKKAKKVEQTQQQEKIKKETKKATKKSSSRKDTPMEAFIKSTARSVGSSVGRQLVRGILGSFKIK